MISNFKSQIANRKAKAPASLPARWGFVDLIGLFLGRANSERSGVDNNYDRDDDDVNNYDNDTKASY